MGEDQLLATWLRVGYTLVGAAAGAVTALSFLRWSEMTKPEIFMTLFVGFSFAVFVTPWMAYLIFGATGTNPQVQAGLTYVMGCGVNSILPPLIRKIKRLVGVEEETK